MAKNYTRHSTRAFKTKDGRSVLASAPNSYVIRRPYMFNVQDFVRKDINTCL